MKGLSSFAMLLLLATAAFAQQNVLIGTDTPNSQAILEIEANNKGILIPRMTTADRNTNITGLDGTDKGLLIYNTTDSLFNYWDGTAWIPFPTSTGGVDDDWYIELGTVSPGSINNNIWTNGNVGIGTNNPSYTLDVRGDILVESGGVEHNIRSGATGSMWLRSNSGVIIQLEEDGGNSGYYRIKSSSGQNLFRVNHNGDATLDGDFTITDGGNELIFEDEADANIIVDHTSLANASLDIEADSGIDIVLDRDNNGTSSEFIVKRNSDSDNAVNKLFAVLEDNSPLVYPYGTATGTTGGIRFRELEANGSNYVGLRAADVLGSNYNLTLPNTDGTVGQLMQTDGTGVLSWIDPTSLPGGGGPDLDWSISGNDVYKTVGTATIGTSTLAGWPLNIVNSTIRRTINVAHTYSGTSATDAVYILNTNNAASGAARIRGIYSQAEKAATSSSTGSVDGAYNWGVNRYSGSTFSEAYGTQSLGYKYSGTSGDAYGIRAEAYNENGGSSYAIYATTGASSSTRYAGFFAGDVFYSGSLIASDKRLKKNIYPGESSLSKILRLPVNSYEFKNSEYQFMNLPVGRQTGFLSQDIKTLFPELVKATTHPSPSEESVKAGITPYHDPVEFDAVNYTGLIPHLVKAIQEQQEMIEALKERIRVLEEKQ